MTVVGRAPTTRHILSEKYYFVTVRTNRGCEIRERLYAVKRSPVVNGDHRTHTTIQTEATRKLSEFNRPTVGVLLPATKSARAERARIDGGR